MKKLYFIVLSILLTANITFSQIEQGGKFTFAGGPMIGYYSSSVSDLNTELLKAGFPVISKNGFLTLGGGGYLEIPMVKGLRIGGFGIGFSESQSSTDLTTAVLNKISTKYSYSGCGITVEYAKTFGGVFDFTIGGAIGIGSLNIDLYKHSPDYTWSGNSSLWDTLKSSNSLHYSSQTYTFEPRIGIGYQITNFLNFKLNAGYTLAIQNTWKVDDVLEVKNVPSGIKAQGFNINLGMNVGIFIK
jgi:hypothetical protein